MDKEKYCILKNDGVALCVCKHRPCEQLKRLQAENERLKEELRTEKIYSSQIEELEESLQRAKAENKELSEENSKLKGKLDAYKMSENEANEIIVELKAENEQLKFQLDNAPLGVLDTYKKALQEIREIADIIANTNCYPVKEAQKIIDKINEVIGAE